jgi:hypothetical protein
VLARTKQKYCKKNMGSLVAQLKVDMMENEGSKTRQMVLKRPLFQRALVFFVEAYMEKLSKMKSDKKRQFIFNFQMQ